MDFGQFKHFVFDLDGTLYDSQGMPLRLIVGDLRHCLLLKSERTVRRIFRGKPFEDADDYYDALFDAISQERKVPVDVVRKWYFEGYMPQTVAILKAHYRARPEVPALFEWIHARGGRITNLRHPPSAASSPAPGPMSACWISSASRRRRS